MGVPPNHPFTDGSSTVNHPAIGVPPFMETSNMVMITLGNHYGESALPLPVHRKSPSPSPSRGAQSVLATPSRSTPQARLDKDHREMLETKIPKLMEKMMGHYGKCWWWKMNFNILTSQPTRGLSGYACPNLLWLARDFGIQFIPSLMLQCFNTLNAQGAFRMYTPIILHDVGKLPEHKSLRIETLKKSREMMLQAGSFT